MGAFPDDSLSSSTASSSSSVSVQSAWEEAQSAFLQPALQPEVLPAPQQVPGAPFGVVTADTSCELGPQKVQHVQSSQLEAPSEAVSDSMAGHNAAELRLVGVDKQQELAEQLLSQLPAQPTAQLSIQMPAQLTAQLMAQSPSQMPAQMPAQLPAQLLGNLLQMQAQHAKSTSSLQPSAVAAQQANGDAVGFMPPVTSALQAADSKSFGNQLAAAGKDAAEAELLPGSDIRLNTEAIAQPPAQPSAQMPAQLPNQMPAQMPAQTPAQMPAQVLAQLPGQMLAHTPAQVPAQLPDQMPAHMPAQTPVQMPIQVPAQVPAHMPAQAPAQMPAQLPAQLPAHMPAHMPAQRPAQMPAQMPAQTPAQAPVQTPPQMPAPMSAQMPAPLSGQMPAQTLAQMPAQMPARMPAQTPAQTPAQMPAQMPAQLPAQLPAAHLPETLAHKEAHPLKSITSLPSSDIAPQSLQQSNVAVIGAVPAKYAACQLAATVGTDAEEVTAAVEPLQTSISGFHTQGLADSAAGCSSISAESSAVASIHAQADTSAPAGAAESAPVLDDLSIASEPGSTREAVAEAPKGDEVDNFVRGISGVWRDVNRSTVFGPESEAEVVTEATIEAEMEPSSSGVSGVWRDVGSPVSSLDSEVLPVPAKDNSSEDLEGFESDRSRCGDASPSSSSEDAAMCSLGSDGKHGDRRQSPPSDLQTLNTPSETLVDDSVCGTIHCRRQQGVHVGLLEGAPPQRIAPAAPPAPSQDALMQQGMAAASARLLVMGSLWGSNLGSLCNLGLILSPSGLILLTSKYEILEIIGEGAYGAALFMSKACCSNAQWYMTCCFQL